MLLDIQFTIAAILLILALLPLYIYRKRIISKFKESDSFPLFVQDIKAHMSVYHPKIKINYSIIERTKNKNDPILREALIIENIVEQFFDYPYEKKTQNPVAKEKLWVNYIEKSQSNAKYPSDWIQRKELAWSRDNRCCNRCAQELSLDNTFTSFVKDISEGGSYSLENIIILCADCNKVINSTNPRNTISSLPLNDKLLFFAQDRH